MAYSRARDVVYDDRLPFEPPCPACGEPTPRIPDLWCLHIDPPFEQVCSDCCLRWHPNVCPDCSGHGWFMVSAASLITATCATCEGTGRINECDEEDE